MELLDEIIADSIKVSLLDGKIADRLYYAHCDIIRLRKGTTWLLSVTFTIALIFLCEYNHVIRVDTDFLRS